MSLRFKLCACERHGRLIGDPGTIPFEIGSLEMAKAMFQEAERLGTFGSGELAAAWIELGRSLLALKDSAIEDALRQRIVLWNTAAGVTNDPEAFAQTDFHAYQALIDDFGSE